MKKKSSSRVHKAPTQTAANKALATACLILAAGGSASANTYDWANSHANSIWDDLLNWSTDIQQSTTDTANFGNLAGSTAITLSTDQTVETVTLGVATGFSLNSLNGAKLTLSSGNLPPSAITGTTTINSGLILGANGIWDIATGGTLATTGGVSGGSFSLTKQGGGTLSMTSAGTYTGDTIIDGGTLLLGAGGSLANAGKVNLTTSSSIFNIAGISSPEIMGSLSGVSGSKVQLGSASLILGDDTDYTFAGDIEGFGGTGTATFNRSYTYTGSTNFSGGTLLLGSSTALPAGAALNLSSGTTLKTGGFSASTGALSVNGNAIFDMANGNSADNFSSVVAWTGVLSVWNHTGAPWKLGTDKLTFASNLGSIALSKVESYSGNDIYTSHRRTDPAPPDLHPVPEPVAAGAAFLLLGALGWRERKTFLHHRDSPPTPPATT